MEAIAIQAITPAMPDAEVVAPALDARTAQVFGAL